MTQQDSKKQKRPSASEQIEKWHERASRVSNQLYSLTVLVRNPIGRSGSARASGFRSILNGVGQELKSLGEEIMTAKTKRGRS
jgi:hypothetical protein